TLDSPCPLTLVCFREIGDCKSLLLISSELSDRSKSSGMLIFPAENQGVMTQGIVTEVGPALVLTEITGEIVIIRTQIKSTAFAFSIENKAAQIQVAVICLVVSGFETEKHGVGVDPAAAEKDHVDPRVKSIQRELLQILAAAVLTEPDQLQSMGIAVMSALIPGIDRLLIPLRQPEHLMRGGITTGSVGIVEGFPGGTHEMNSKSPRTIQPFNFR